MTTINKDKETICADFITTNYKYDPKTGVITKNNAPVGSLHPKGHLELYFRHKDKIYCFKYHRIAWFLYYKKFPEDMIDHIDGNKLNNRIDNLRDCNNSENLCNRSKQKNNKSGYKNVLKDNRECGSGKWIVRIMKNGKTYFGGHYINIEDAIVAADKLRKEVHNIYSKE